MTMTMTITVNGYYARPGCWVAGHHGQYAVDELVEICREFDIPVRAADDIKATRQAISDIEGDESIDPVARAKIIESNYDSIDWAATHLETMLNDATDGGYWEWQEGELFLVRTRVDGHIYVVAESYEEAWAELVTNGCLQGGYLDREEAQDYIDECCDDDAGLEVFEFTASANYEPR